MVKIHYYIIAIVIILVTVFSGYTWKNHNIAIHRMHVETCANVATSIYQQNWANECNEYAIQIATNLNNCIKESHLWNKTITGRTYGYNSKELKDQNELDDFHCKQTYVTFNPTPNCRLPAFLADSLNSEYNRQLAQCNSIS